MRKIPQGWNAAFLFPSCKCADLKNRKPRTNPVAMTSEAVPRSRTTLGPSWPGVSVVHTCGPGRWITGSTTYETEPRHSEGFWSRREPLCDLGQESTAEAVPCALAPSLPWVTTP